MSLKNAWRGAKISFLAVAVSCAGGLMLTGGCTGKCTHCSNDCQKCEKPCDKGCAEGKSEKK